MKNQNKAFTLAEVLITIGIIGIVAAFVMPVLVTDVRTDVKTKRIENIKQKLSKATDKMAVVSGLTGYGDTMSFVNEMTRHMKVVKVCDNNHLADCWPTKEVNLKVKGKTWDVSKTKGARNLKISKSISSSWTDTVGIVTADGVSMILSYNKDCNFDIDRTGLVYSTETGVSNSLGCLSGVFDWNGAKNPNKIGDDVLPFGMAKGIGDACAFEVGETCYTAPFFPIALSRSECAQVKDKLGIKNCVPKSWQNNADFWAGAVKQCGGVENLPTVENLAELASLLYHAQIGTYQETYDDNLKLDASAAASIGLSLPRGYVSLWSNKEIDGYRAYKRYFENNWTAVGSWRDSGFHQAVCVGD